MTGSMIPLVLTALLPVYVGLAAGYVAGARGLVDNRNVAGFNVLLMQILLPLTLFMAIARTPRGVLLGNGGLMLVLACTLVCVFVPVLLLQMRGFRLGLGEAAVQSLTTAFPNFASIGLPLLVPVFGAGAALPVAVAIAVGSVTISPLTLALLELHKDGVAGTKVSPVRAFGRALGRSVRKPIFLGPVLGLCVSLAGLHPPALAVAAAAPLTAATAGTGLFLTGLMLSAQRIGIDANVLVSTAIKTLLQPLLALGFGLLFGMGGRGLAEAVLLCAIPSGFFGLVFGNAAGVRPQVAGSTLVLSSAVGLVTLSVAILTIGRI